MPEIIFKYYDFIGVWHWIGLTVGRMPSGGDSVRKNAHLHHVVELRVGVSNKHHQVNLYLCALGLDGALKDTRFILVRAECPYVQSVAARVISTKNGS